MNKKLFFFSILVRVPVLFTYGKNYEIWNIS